MYNITDQLNKKIVLIYRNMILNTDGDTVLGIAVGDCLFNSRSVVFGKIIRSTAYDLKGEIIGRAVLANPALNFNITQEQLKQAWNILSNITVHTCPWIQMSEEWALHSFADHLA